MRLIDADALKTKKVRCAERREWVVPVAEIDWMPTIEPKKGRWINDKGEPVGWDDRDEGVPKESCWCSICGEWLVASDEYAAIGNYCPNCGAYMRGELNA